MNTVFSGSVARRQFILVTGIGLIGTLAGCKTADIFPADGDTARAETDAALPLVNDLRAKKGLLTLGKNPAAEAAALAQAKRMARAGEMSHLIGFNDDFLGRMKKMDVPLPAAENIAAGQDDVADAVDAWIRSEKHLHNMLGEYRGLGVAVANDPSSANRPYWAMVLAG
ncbi:MAG: CAP domain-containing protein [Rhizobium sp.]